VSLAMLIPKLEEENLKAGIYAAEIKESK